MTKAVLLHSLLIILAFSCVSLVKAEDPYRFFTWEVTYGTISPLGFLQRGILINGQFPGPTLDWVTNDNIIINVINKLDEPFLITWNGIKQRKSSWQDGVLGTNCPIPPNSNWTYTMQMKDQIGTYNYFPSTLMHRASGGFGGLNLHARSVIPVPYPEPAEEFTVLVSDWWKADHKTLQQTLDSGNAFPFPDAILINGSPKNVVSFAGEKGQRYLFRVSNIGFTTSINFRIQGHNMTLVEVEGSHTLQEKYEWIDVHVGQSVAVLVTLNMESKDYFIVASTRFTKPILTTTAILHYNDSTVTASGPLPVAPTYQLHLSMKHARTIRWNLTANAARPNPQGSFHYGQIPIVRTLILQNTAAKVDGKTRYAINGVSHVNPATPLKLADWLNIPDVFTLNLTKSTPMTPPGPVSLEPSVIGLSLHDFVEIVFQNTENTVQTWHLDGHDFWTVAFGNGQWNTTMRRRYNRADATTRNTVQVYPYGWSVILVSLDNKGMWNLRSANWARQYLGQQLYFKVWNDEPSLFTEYNPPVNQLFCGLAHP
ncbi:L-ascorbate oxidase homolog [Impatiens glandulifera]|uniref:L-ascorbate oxidase homolog n=1 Tax=Impatiens glandulifera TaxID=253017 RepID=UPI001FB0B093|nr:L-ascorbate oxidase homolog [Impatiens glandulifera]